LRTTSYNKLIAKELHTDERAIITQINGNKNLRAYLLSNGITIGTIVYKNYSPKYSGLISMTINGKMISLRSRDFENIELVKI